MSQLHVRPCSGSSLEPPDTQILQLPFRQREAVPAERYPSVRAPPSASVERMEQRVPGRIIDSKYIALEAPSKEFGELGEPVCQRAVTVFNHHTTLTERVARATS